MPENFAPFELEKDGYVLSTDRSLLMSLRSMYPLEGRAGLCRRAAPHHRQSIAAPLIDALTALIAPVLTIQTFVEEEEALALADHPTYGLAAGIFTTDLSRALRMTKKMQAARSG
jgi:hypothetical protein